MMKTPTIAHAPAHITEKNSEVKRLRISNLLTQTELAELAGVPQNHVDLFERGLPVPLDSRRRILKVLWATKAKK
jgi:DNA-binding transcriptional regulator YiaG